MLTEHCIICTEPVENFAISECNHRNICSKCYVINLKHYNNRYCITCKTEYNNVIITNNSNKTFNDFNIKKLHYNHKFEKTYFDNRSVCSELCELFAIACPECNMKASSLNDLKQHIRVEHKKSFCSVCLKKRKGIVIRKQRLYTNNDLNRHRQYGDSATVDEGLIPPHTKCTLCGEHCYDVDDRNIHMINAHICCQLCRRKSIEEWVLDSNALVQHYKSSHIVCDDPVCCQMPIENVYDDEISYRAHMMSIHGTKFSKQELRDTQRLQIDFRVRHESSSSTAIAVSKKLEENMDESQLIKFSGDAKDQNLVMIAEIKKLKGESGFVHFRDISAQYFRKEMSSEQYYNYFKDMFSDFPTASSLWMLLVSNLPDPTLRSELHQIHYTSIKAGGGFHSNTRKVSKSSIHKEESVSNSRNERRRSKKKNHNKLDDAVIDVESLAIKDDTHSEPPSTKVEIIVPKADTPVSLSPEIISNIGGTDLVNNSTEIVNTEELVVTSDSANGLGNTSKKKKGRQKTVLMRWG
jgi:hypothetical protein